MTVPSRTDPLRGARGRGEGKMEVWGRGSEGRGWGETGAQGQASDTTSLYSLWTFIAFCMSLSLASTLSYLYRLELPLIG